MNKLLKLSLFCLFSLSQTTHAAEQTTKTNCGSFEKLAIATVSKDSTRFRKPYKNQDQSLFELNDELFFSGVFDGHGCSNGKNMRPQALEDFDRDNNLEAGGAIASYVSTAYLHSIKEKIKTNGKALLDHQTYIDAAHELQAKIKSNERLKSIAIFGGSTATMVVINQTTGKLISINTGDSRTIIIDSQGECTFTTIDHNPNEPTIEAPRLKEAQKTNPNILLDENRLGGLSVSRAFGDLHFELNDQCQATDKLLDYGLICTPDVKTVQLNDGDMIILASDGLWDTINNKDCAAFIQQEKSAGATLSVIAERLTANASLKSNDDITVQIIKYYKNPFQLRDDVNAQALQPTWGAFARHLITEHKLAIGVTATATAGLIATYYLKLNPIQRKRLIEATIAGKDFAVNTLSNYFKK